MNSRGWNLEDRGWMIGVGKFFNFQFSIFNFWSLCVIGGLIGCSNQKSSKSIKFDQYFIQGEQLYLKHCSNCHQPTGTGLGLVYPPLNKSDFMESHFEEVICLMKYGREGELIVNGKSYIQPMPGVASLTDIEIAEIATYIYNSWEHKRGIVEVSTISTLIQNCKQ